MSLITQLGSDLDETLRLLGDWNRLSGETLTKLTPRAAASTKSSDEVAMSLKGVTTAVQGLAATVSDFEKQATSASDAVMTRAGRLKDTATRGQESLNGLQATVGTLLDEMKTLIGSSTALLDEHSQHLGEAFKNLATARQGLSNGLDQSQTATLTAIAEAEARLETARERIEASLKDTLRELSAVSTDLGATAKQQLVSQLKTSTSFFETDLRQSIDVSLDDLKTASQALLNALRKQVGNVAEELKQAVTGLVSDVEKLGAQIPS
ncbi:MAG: hypothetical protein EB084_26405, partial [Proteobacteria bacterium]|nr:hypothetical protein [Pseudomonadota bacterium]